jgi:hypothetical protein
MGNLCCLAFGVQMGNLCCLAFGVQIFELEIIDKCFLFGLSFIWIVNNVTLTAV